MLLDNEAAGAPLKIIPSSRHPAQLIALSWMLKMGIPEMYKMDFDPRSNSLTKILSSTHFSVYHIYWKAHSHSFFA